MLKGMEFALLGVSILVFIGLMIRLPSRRSRSDDSPLSANTKK
jgi:hypothetical protein